MAEPGSLDATALARENEELRQQLHEAEELIVAVRTGAVDALAIQGADGPRIFTLEGADQSYRMLVEQMNEGALLLSSDGMVLYCNEALAELLHCPLEEMLGTTVSSFVPAAFQEYWADVVAKGWAGRVRGELPLQTREGALKPCSVSMNVLPFNGAPALAVLVTDVSAQQQIENIRAVVAKQNTLIDLKNEELVRQQAARLAVEQAAAQAQRLLEGIPQIAWTATPEGRNSYLNQRWFDYVGDVEPNPETPITSRVHPDDYEASMQRWRQSLTTGLPLDIECRLRNEAGEYRWMLGRGRALHTKEGAISQWIGTFTDINEHRLALERVDQAQQMLRDNNEALTRVNVDLDNFIYTASHDLRAPITNIEGLVQALRSELPDSAAPSEPEPASQIAFILNLMQDSVERFKRTIDHLTDVSKLQREHSPITEQVHLATVVQDVLLDLEPLTNSVGAQLEVEVADCPPIAFSEKNLRSVVYNLLSNAVKYRAPERPPLVKVRAHCTEHYVLLEVQDNGLGISEAGQRKLFGMFQRLHDHVEGSGIGLYMVKRMVENIGGRIEVSSELGVGSTFTVYFPH
ncbi:PAS domain S-box protein [Hymenobacter setariae]|uniref:histidine kinase n=1 Tax=Hymenobacter setariae TaxID=2594794 RepID=A0A558BSN0_9BACT|nr:ATP-binding protein [Hymenobacter setariae]TVT39499.1 PAS domain S-box protein [Hymenobacter setariae]